MALMLTYPLCLPLGPLGSHLLPAPPRVLPIVPDSLSRCHPALNRLAEALLILTNQIDRASLDLEGTAEIMFMICFTEEGTRDAVDE